MRRLPDDPELPLLLDKVLVVTVPGIEFGMEGNADRFTGRGWAAPLSGGQWTDGDREQKERFDTHEEWKTKVEEGREKAEELNRRFAGWYYVISADAFDKVRVTRRDLVKAKES